MNRAESKPTTTLTGRVIGIMPDLTLIVNTGLAYFVPFARN